jgi:hypothetical protein
LAVSMYISCSSFVIAFMDRIILYFVCFFGFGSLKELDGELQKRYIISARTKNVYSQFLIDLFQNRFFDDSNLQYKKIKKFNKKKYNNILFHSKKLK